MLTLNKVKTAINQGREVVGLMNSVPLPMLIEMIGYAGFDFVILDIEHLLRDPSELQHAIRAAQCADIVPFVRVPGAIPYLIKQALDAGAMGIVVPQVNNKQEAQIAVDACRYPPLGTRGITGGVNTGFGRLTIDEYITSANEEIMLMLMIESQQGLDNLDDILSVSGINMILEGALDLAVSLGQPQSVHHPEVQAAIEYIAERCQAHQVPFCAIPRAEGQLEKWREKGIRQFVAGQDRGILSRALKAQLSPYK
ncbi:HpcH/HpaI aldolase family protein [Catenovulum sediminis]|uniref:Aldolase/citrate lyase family protein n=1 Tax=Catenovulum sediminis TaxID=1740262 RepID=A0ABV1RCK4_9ALTE|nr:aldolase/citrate lyase family protein [Catenovulum sediminis]